MNYFRIALNKYAVFTGRARRKEFWIFHLSYLIIVYSLAYVAPILGGLFGLGFIIPDIAVGVRRMHDINKSGWYFLFPLYNLILACTDGTKGNNEYGSDPKEGEKTGGVYNQTTKVITRTDEKTNIVERRSDICKNCGTEKRGDTCKNCGRYHTMWE